MVHEVYVDVDVAVRLAEPGVFAILAYFGVICPYRCWTESLKRHPDGQRIIHSQDGLLSKPCFVLFSNLLDLDALLIPRRHRVEQDQNDGPLPLDLAFGIKELPPAC